MSNLAHIFGADVFNGATMKSMVAPEVYERFVKLTKEGGTITREIADPIAAAMKDWAMSKGATHFTHVFQPYIISIHAEKHDSFCSVPNAEGKIEADFDGKNLMMGEPDASSFPSGGLRHTCAARGYTVWDTTSPAYVKENMLCIPTAFCSYTGEALDTKTPLLRSMDAVNQQGLRLLKLFGMDSASKVTSYVGPEQEFFLVDEKLWEQRPDLIYAGRTLFGAMAPKGQEMDDQYFSSISPKVKNYLKDVNEQLWKLGVTAKTEHKEVAPGQYEVAPIFSVSNVALDNNQITMDVLKKTAAKHGLVCLLHEKPFAGVNGSGKHNNWSIGADDGTNFFKPGAEPHKNKLFLLVLACLAKAVDQNAVLLRAAASNAGNDHRLGANEAPPAIISIYLGDQVGDVVDQILKNGKATSSLHNGLLDLGVSTLPVLEKDPTDRNRTSPFAFTGNRFEFRMVASSNSIGDANTVLNTMMADAFSDACDALEGAADFDTAVDQYIYETLTAHQRVIFNGNGYSEEWQAEAERRGLPNKKSIVDALPAYTYDSTVEMFEKFHVLTRAELASREEVLNEQYAGIINIEAKTMVDMAVKTIIPAVINYTTKLATSISTVKAACPAADTSVQEGSLIKISALLAEAQAATDALNAAIEEASSKECAHCMAKAYHEEVFAAMTALRTPVDALEGLVAKGAWPMPTYGDLLFLK